jgi:hypothetical protein
MASDEKCPKCGKTGIEYVPYIPVCRHCYLPKKFWPFVRDLQRRAEIGQRLFDSTIKAAIEAEGACDKPFDAQSFMEAAMTRFMDEWDSVGGPDARAAGMVP